MGSRYLNVFFPFRDIYSHTSFSTSPVTAWGTFPASPLPISQTIGHNPWVSTKLHAKTLFFPRKASNQVHCIGIFPIGRLFYTIIISVCPREGLGATAVHFFGGDGISCRTAYKPGLGLLFLCQLIRGNSPWGKKWGRIAGVGTMSIWATSSYNLFVS